MKRFTVCFLTLAMLLTLAVVGTSAASLGVDEATWEALELQPLYVQSDTDMYSDVVEDYFEIWWNDEVSEVDSFLTAATVNMRGFALSHDGKYAYLGTLNGGSGVRGLLVLDTATGVIRDLYRHYDGEAGDQNCPFSYAKGVAADDRGYVYTGFAFSKNYNVVYLGITEQKEDGTLEELCCEAVYEYGAPGDEGGIHVGVNGVDVAKVGDRYYCYVMVNYDYDALYCYDVTDPANPALNEAFGTDGVIIFSDESNTVVGNGFTLKEGQYLDVDSDGIIWLCVNSNEETDGIMRIAPDGSACAEVIELKGVYCVEHVDTYLLCGMKDGSCITVLDDSSYDTVGTVALPEDYGDRVTRIQVANGALFVCDAGADSNMMNAIHVAALNDDGEEFIAGLMASLAGDVGEDTGAGDGSDTSVAEEVTTAAEEPQETTTTEEQTTASTADSAAVTEDSTVSSPETEGCSSALLSGVALTLLVGAAFVMRKKQ